jgi:hypothetical protein
MSEQPRHRLVDLIGLSADDAHELGLAPVEHVVLYLEDDELTCTRAFVRDDAAFHETWRALEAEDARADAVDVFERFAVVLVLNGWGHREP